MKKSPRISSDKLKLQSLIFKENFKKKSVRVSVEMVSWGFWPLKPRALLMTYTGDSSR